MKIKILVSMGNEEIEGIPQEIEITKEDLMQLACNKAKEIFADSYNKYSACDEIEIIIS